MSNGEQQFPQIAINITPDGMVFTLLLSPNTTINQGIPAEQMDDICKKWREVRRQSQNSLEIVRNMDVIRDIKKGH